MSLRKNFHKYVPAVAGWNRIIGMDIYGDWDEDAARSKVAADPDRALAALEAAVAECIDGFKINPSCPALDQCLGLIAEGRIAGIVGHDLDALSSKANDVWKRERENAR